MNFWYILLAILIFGVLIFIHELGHFIVARLCGVKILEFSIGMGPKLFSHRGKKSGTAYSLRAFPIGGYVNMLGENGMEAVQGSAEGSASDETAAPSARDFFLSHEEEDEPERPKREMDPELAAHAYCNKSVWVRMLISVAGPLMNILLGFLLMVIFVISSGASAMGGTTVAGFYISCAEDTGSGFCDGDSVQSVDGKNIYSFADFRAATEDGLPHTVVVTRYDESKQTYGSVTLDGVILGEGDYAAFRASLSEQSGLRVGDEILRVNSTRVHTYNELAYEVMYQGYRPMKITVLRDGEEVVLDEIAVPSVSEGKTVFGNLDFRVFRESEFSFGTVMKHAWYRSLSTVKMVIDSVKGLLTGRIGAEAVSGPVGITKTVSTAARNGWLTLLYLVTVLTVNLGVMNLLPLPALDGGHLLLYLFELIRGKPLRPEVEGIINAVGLFAMLVLTVIIAVKDVIAL